MTLVQMQGMFISCWKVIKSSQSFRLNLLISLILEDQTLAKTEVATVVLLQLVGVLELQSSRT